MPKTIPDASLARYFADRHSLDYGDAVICLVHSLLREAEQCADWIYEAAFVLGFIGRSFYELAGGDSDSSESSKNIFWPRDCPRYRRSPRLGTRRGSRPLEAIMNKADPNQGPLVWLRFRAYLRGE